MLRRREEFGDRTKTLVYKEKIYKSYNKKTQNRLGRGKGTANSRYVWTGASGSRRLRLEDFKILGIRVR
jgi:hypothetical protein